MTWDTTLRLLNIAVIDVALSGDNAIVIGMAAAALPRGQRRWAIALGGVGAIGLRVVLTSMATLLMLVPFLAAGGGLVLVWVVYKLLRSDAAEGEDGQARRATTFRQAILLIVVADFMMSLDNVIAVAGSAHGSIPLLVVGLLLSMPLLLTTGGLVSMLIDRLHWLVWVGAFAISFTAVRMIFEDRGVESRLHATGPVVLACSVAAGLLVPGACWALQAQRVRAKEHPDAG
jgi:YjbE family integral membrane protein